MIRRLLNVKLNAKQPFNISQICHETLEKASEDKGTSNSWEKPNTYTVHATRSSNTSSLGRGAWQIRCYLQYREQTRGTNKGPDPKPTTVSRQTLLLQAKTICGGHAEHQAEEQEHEGISIARAMCQQCTHLTRRGDGARVPADSRQYPCCEMERHRAEPPSAHPCRVCVCQWLLQHNGPGSRES
jgi:hypothetical protein